MAIKQLLESEPKADLTKVLRIRFPRYVILRIEDGTTGGIPDICIVGHKITSWLEVKLANPDFKSKGLQEIVMKRLDREGYARYVIFEDIKGKRRTYLVEHKDLKSYRDSPSVEGWDYHWICDWVQRIHDHPIGA